MNTARLRLWMVSPNYPPTSYTCGVGDYSAWVSSGLAGAGWDITAICSSRHTGNDFDGPVRVVKLAARFGWMAGFALLRRAMRGKPDIICIQHTPTLYGFGFRLMVCVIARFSPVAVCYHTLHGSTFLSKLGALMLLRFCQAAISTNEEVSAILSRYPRTCGKFEEIHISTNIMPRTPEPSLADARRTLAVPESAAMLCNFGLYYEGRGVETLLQACSILKQRKTPFVLYLLGSIREGDAPYTSLIRNMIGDLSLQDDVKVTGLMDDERLSLHLLAADLYVVPYDDGATIRRGSLLAGIAHGCAIVTTQAGLKSALLDESHALVRVPAKNAAALADAIHDLLRNPGKREDLRTKARELRKRFSRDDIVRRLHEAFLRITGAGS